MNATPRSSPGRDGRGHGRLVLALLCLVVLAGCHLPRWPVDAPLISGFGLRFMGSRPDVHRGVDLNAPTGTPVQAMAGGRVRFSGVMRGFGNVVWVDHAGGLLSIYAHLSELRVRQGDSVDTGQLIGLSGATGNAASPHLHFEVWRWGRPVDPIPILGGRPRS